MWLEDGPGAVHTPVLPLCPPPLLQVYERDVAELIRILALLATVLQDVREALAPPGAGAQGQGQGGPLVPYWNCVQVPGQLELLSCTLVLLALPFSVESPDTA